MVNHDRQLDGFRLIMEMLDLSVSAFLDWVSEGRMTHPECEWSLSHGRGPELNKKEKVS